VEHVSIDATALAEFAQQRQARPDELSKIGIAAREGGVDAG
jgi:hypothetical protein